MTEETRPEPAEGLTRADLSPSCPTLSPDVGRVVQALRQAEATYRECDHASEADPDDKWVELFSEAADLIVEQQAEIEKQSSAADMIAVEREAWKARAERETERATKAEALLVKRTEALERIVSAILDSQTPLSDCIDNTGAHYQSQYFADAIKDARALLAITEVLG